MQIVLNEKYCAERSVLALGMFDGVHIGHRVLLERAAALARRENVPLVVCTFQQHPLQVIAPEKCPPMLSTFEERNQLMEAMGVDVLCAMPFTPEVMSMLPEEYVGHLVRRFHPVHIVCGYNHTFGCKGQGTPVLLEALGGALGFQTSVVPKITLNGEDVSSSVIREQLARGAVDSARRFLGRPYELSAALTMRDGSLCCLKLFAHGKRTVPEGDYRCFLCDAEHAYPVLAHVEEDGATACMLPQKASVSGEMCLQFWSTAPLAF